LVGITAFSTDPNGPAVTFALSDDAGGRFAINATTGVVTGSEEHMPDLQAPCSHVIPIPTSSQARTTSSQTFTINVSDVTPTTPTDSAAGATLFPYTTLFRSLVGITAFSTDPNGPAVTFALSDDAGGRFAINATTGVVT